MSEDNPGGERRRQFQMVIPRLDGPQPKPPPIEPPVPIPAAEDARRRPDPPIRRFVWSQYLQSGFPNRVNHATAVCRASDGRDYMYSIGGFHSSDEERAARLISEEIPHFHTGPIDIHKLDIASRVWQNVTVIRKTKNKDIPIRGGQPARRYGHTCVSYDRKIYMYGGRNDDDGSFRVMECYDTERNMWLKIHVLTDGCSLPQSRDGHACCTQGKYMYMHGGFDTNSLVFTGDLYRFDMESHTWSLLPEQGDKLSERDFHSAVCLEDRIVVFGGRSDVAAPNFSNTDIYDESFYEYILEKQTWVKATGITGFHPLGRRSMSAVRYDIDKVLYFGGYNARYKTHFNDIFVYNSTTKHIIQIEPFGIPPTPRRRPGQALVGNEFIICGGTSPVQVKIGGSEHLILHDHDDMYILNLLPTLQQLAMIAVKTLHISTAVLPAHIRLQLKDF